MITIHKVKCKYCGIVFDRDKEPYEQISERRYAHLKCAIAAKNEKTQAEKDKEDRALNRELHPQLQLPPHKDTLR